MLWAVAGLLGGLLLAEVLLQARFVPVVLAMFDNTPHFSASPLPPDPEAERFETKTRDGLTLKGALYRQTQRVPRGLVVFCHEYRSNGWSAMLYGSALWKAGFDVLSFDFRNHGESDQLPDYRCVHWLTSYEITDLTAILDYVQQRPDLKQMPLGLFGISRGGSAALAVASQRREVRCVATDGAFDTTLIMTCHSRRWISLWLGDKVAEFMPWWHIQFTLWLSRLTSQLRRRVRYVMLGDLLPKLQQLPMLIVSGGRDTYVLPEVAQEICQLAGKPDVLWLVPQAKHNQARQQDPVEYDRRLVNFFGVLDGQAEGPLHQESTSDTDSARHATGTRRKAR